MIPDFPLFSPLSPSYETTHSVPGLFSACLPLGLAGFLLFEFLMKRPLLALMPRAIQRGCSSFRGPRVGLNPRVMILTSLAMVAGAATHVFWDSFTHRGRWGTRVFPSLNETALTFWGHAFPGFKLLQYGSTLIGLPCLLLLLGIWLSRREAAGHGEHPELPAFFKVAAFLVGVAIPLSVTLLIWHRDGVSKYERIGRSITFSGLCLMFAILVYCLAFHVVEWRLMPLGDDPEPASMDRQN